ncbi:MAG: hypothetical protein II830_02040 [Alphaproteobacteria bacterium]|nr:hypothetical protein [Alphaproteobacteria bacterium]
MRNKILAVLLFLPVIGLGFYMLWLQTMTEFRRVEIAVAGYDPRDFFSGNYMNLRLDWNSTDCSQFKDNVCPKEDFDLFYHFYIRQENSQTLTQKVNAGDVKLVFSYEHGYKPMIVDLSVNGKSYIDFVKESKR